MRRYLVCLHLAAHSLVVVPLVTAATAKLIQQLSDVFVSSVT